MPTPLPDPLSDSFADPQKVSRTSASATDGALVATQLRCIRCGAEYPAEELLFGCPACAETVPANLEVVVDTMRFDGPTLRRRWEARPPGLWRYGELLPVSGADAISLGEGGTPLIACPQMGAKIGLPRLGLIRKPTYAARKRSHCWKQRRAQARCRKAS